MLVWLAVCPSPNRWQLCSSPLPPPYGSSRETSTRTERYRHVCLSVCLSILALILPLLCMYKYGIPRGWRDRSRSAPLVSVCLLSLDARGSFLLCGCVFILLVVSTVPSERVSARKRPKTRCRLVLNATTPSCSFLQRCVAILAAYVPSLHPTAVFSPFFFRSFLFFSFHVLSRPQEYDAVNGSYRITPEVLGRAKASAVLMHPLPRVGEVTEDCDLDPRAAYFKQMEVRCCCCFAVAIADVAVAVVAVAIAVYFWV